MPKSPQRYARPIRRHSSGVASYVRAHRVRALAALAVATTVVIGAVAITNASAEEAIPVGAVRAESFAEQQGVQLEGTADVGGGKNVGWLANGDWMRYNGLDLGSAGGLTTSVRVAAASNDGGTVELRVDSPTGQLIASIPIKATGGWQAWVTKSDTQPSPGGKRDVFLLIKSNHPWDFVNVNWMMFATSGGPTPTPSGTPAQGTPTPSPTATATVPGNATTMAGPPPATGWVPVDQAAWNAQLAAFHAMTPRPIPANRKKNPEFNASCAYSHSAPDDPIVFPRLKGASHMHSFVGNDRTNADTTTDDLMKFTASSCKPVEDHSAYWVPTLYENGQPAEPKEVVVYYGSLLPDRTKTVPMPQGLRMIAGDAKKQQPTPGLGGPGEF